MNAERETSNERETTSKQAKRQAGHAKRQARETASNSAMKTGTSARAIAAGPVIRLPGRSPGCARFYWTRSPKPIS